MYERIDPFREYVAEGYLDMSHCHYEQIAQKTTRITGPQTSSRATKVWVKIEGSGKVAERDVFISASVIPYTITNIDRAIDWAKGKLAERFGDAGLELQYNVYGRNGVMGALEPPTTSKPNELGIVVEVTCQDAEIAEKVCMIGREDVLCAAAGCQGHRRLRCLHVG